MRYLRQHIFSSCLAWGLSLSLASAWADTPTTQESNDPTPVDLQNSQDRMFLKPLYPTVQSHPVKAQKIQSAASAKPKKATSGKTAPKSIPAAIKPSANAPVIQAVSSAGSTDSLILSAWLNHSGQPPIYKIGEKLQVNIKASKDCNVTVFDFDEHGTLTQIFPNDYQPSGYLKAGETVAIGGPDSAFDYELAGNGGSERIFVYAYPIGTSNPITVAFTPQTNSPFRSTPFSLSDYRKLINESRVFFTREVKVVPKSGVKPIAAVNSTGPNKVELPFLVSPQ